MGLSDMPFIVALAEWVWGSNSDPSVSASQCLSTIPLPLLTFGAMPCLSALIAKAVGVAILWGSLFNKAPVMANIWNAQSVASMAVGAAYGEVIMYSNSGWYNVLRGNPFTAYGETMIVLVQTLAIVGLIWRFRDPVVGVGHVAMAVAGYAVYLYIVFQVLTPDTYYMMMAYNLPVLIYSRGAQISANYSAKQTGAQSQLTTMLNLVGSAVRVFTTIQEVGWDFNILRAYGLSIGLNAVLLAQIVVYRANTDKFLKELKDKKKD